MEAKRELQRLKNEFSEKKNSHVFLVETDDLDRSLLDIKEIIKDLVAKDDVTRNQIDEDNYLELITIRSEAKDIKKDEIMELQIRLRTKPVLGDYLIYIILPAERINEISANKLLKTIEEPNKNVIGFLITTNRDLILPTIKSRCESVSLIYRSLSDCSIPDNVFEIVSKLINGLEKMDHHLYVTTRNSDKNIKENARNIENLLKDYYNTACNFKSKYELDENLIEMIKKNNTTEALIQKTKYFNTIFNNLTRSMNFELLLEKVFLDLKGVK